ncbi:response regulator transcription factor [Streptomyces sp. IBSBF 3010]|uniref:response regulator transcription factor n=1 Tax=Streptomyces sp. IBSBF 3010 TaxID=2903526 RepID=UPI002FDBF617
MIKRASGQDALRIALFQHDPILRRGIRSMLVDAGVDVVAATAEIDRAPAVATASFPDVVVVDLDWRSTTVLEICHSLTQDVGVRGILALTRHCHDAALLRSALGCGVRGYLPKLTRTAELVGALHAVAGGSMVVSDTAARLLTGLLNDSATHAGRGMVPELTRRELEILELVARGYDNRRIARLLTLADKTVRNHVSAIFGKFDADSRAQVVVHARKAGFGLGG